MPMIPALFVVWAKEGRILKLSDAFSDAMFTTTPRLVLRCGQVARLR
jgi:hypothetical protein